MRDKTHMIGREWDRFISQHDAPRKARKARARGKARTERHLRTDRKAQRSLYAALTSKPR